MFNNLNIVIGISGGIAAYKACGIISYLKKEGANIFTGNAVLIPRDIRKNGKIYYSKNPVSVTTNFIVCNLNYTHK